jgi:transposase
VDVETGAIVAVTLQEADQGNTTTIQTTLPEAVEQLEAVAAINDNVKTGDELVTDKGYHSKQTVLDMQSLGLRTYISEPDRGRQHWIDQHAERDAVYANGRAFKATAGGS